MTADLHRGPPTGAIGDRRSWRRDPFVDLAPRANRTVRIRTLPSLLRPHQSRRASKHRQIDQHDIVATMTVNTAPAACTHRSRSAGRDRNPQPPRPITNTIHVDVGQPDKQFTHTRRISFQQGLLELRRRKTPPDSQSPCVTPAIPTAIRSATKARTCNREQRITNASNTDRAGARAVDAM